LLLEVLLISSVKTRARRHKWSLCGDQFSSMRNNEWTSLASILALTIHAHAGATTSRMRMRSRIIDFNSRPTSPQ
jgi:hypothetical protein